VVPLQPQGFTVKKLVPLILFLACSHEPTGIGEQSRCIKTTEAVQTFMLLGDPNVYALEIGACTYRVDLPQASVRDSVHVSFSLENVVNRRVR
jgi:hypothetical protein